MNCPLLTTSSTCTAYSYVCKWVSKNSTCIYKQYTISFDPNGGECDACTPITQDYRSEIVLPIPNPTNMTEPVFAGWYDNKNNLIKSPMILTKDVSLTAKWEEESSSHEKGASNTLTMRIFVVVILAFVLF